MNNETLFADVIIPLAVPSSYTYRVPADWNKEVMEGKRVLVQFGKAKIYTAIICKIHDRAPTLYQAKYLEALLDEEPVVGERQLSFWEWLSDYYMVHPGEVMNAALPSALKLSSESHIQLNPEFGFDEITSGFFTATEEKIIDLLHINSSLEINQVAQALGMKSVGSHVNKLIKKGAIFSYEDVKEKYKPKMVTLVRLSEKYRTEEALSEIINTLEKKAFKQAEVVLAYLSYCRLSEDFFPDILKTELIKKTSQAALNALVKKGVFSETVTQVDRIKQEEISQKTKHLTNYQQEALEKIRASFNQGKPAVLMGVTGSGKTEVYIKLIEETVKQGKQVLYLVPEIALTTQLIIRLQAVLGAKVAVYHSRFSDQERVEIWNKVLRYTPNNEAHCSVILAARSGVFLPFNYLGLVIIDEEHDYSFKQQSPSPRYHARDAAVYLASIFKAQVLLGSATPSLETYHNTKTGKYTLVELSKPYAQDEPTRVEICDLNFYDKSNQMKGMFTPPLYEAIRYAIGEKRQVILFQNRRGFAPYLSCRTCAHIIYCVRCDVPLIYHKYIHRLKCHYCGYNSEIPLVCPACNSSDLRYSGIGTEKVEEEIEILFPDARVARLDMETTRSKYAYKQILDEFEQGNTDILVGTQMVTKGLDFDRVDVVGIINADSFLNFPDFRSFERAYQLMVQLKGRAGRKHRAGKLFVQTNQMTHPVIGYVKQDNIHDFYSLQLTEREKFQYPPYYRIIQVQVISKSADECEYIAGELANMLKLVIQGVLLGPEKPLISKVKNQHYRKLLIKIPKQDSLKQAKQEIKYSLQKLQSNFKNLKFYVQVDVDPV